MVRTRLASLGLATALIVVSGCNTCSGLTCNGNGNGGASSFLSRLNPRNWHRNGNGTACCEVGSPCCEADAPCCNGGAPGVFTGLEGPVMAGPELAPVTPGVVPLPGTVPNGSTMPPLAPPPRVVPVPQTAAPMPYTPSGLIRR